MDTLIGCVCDVRKHSQQSICKQWCTEGGKTCSAIELIGLVLHILNVYVHPYAP